MTMQECYKAIGGNYEAVLGRLHSEALIQRFTLKFLEDQSYLQLKQTLENKNYEDAFRSAHTLKGVCQNLSFDRLYEVSDKSLPNQIYSQSLVKVIQQRHNRRHTATSLRTGQKSGPQEPLFAFHISVCRRCCSCGQTAGPPDSA